MISNLKKICTLLFSLVVASAIKSQDKPNILWFTFEDTSPDFIGCYDNNTIKTPNIDALSKEAIRYTNAYSTNTICSPSRQTIITGVRTSADGTGNHRSNYKIPSYIKGFASYLKEGGYYTTNNKKTDYNIAKEKEFIALNWNESSTVADYSHRKEGQPFFAIYNSATTHQSRTMTESFAYYEKEVLSTLTKAEQVNENEILMPPFYLQNPDMRKNVARMYNCIVALDKELGAMVKRLKSEGLWENTIIFFYSDHGQGMPNFKTHSSRLGYQVPFIVRVPEKYKQHADYRNGSVTNDLITFEDLAPSILKLCNLAVPTYMKGKDILRKDSVKKDVFWGCRDNTDEVIDMARTIIKDSFVYTRNFYPHLAVLQHEEYFDKSDVMKQIRGDYNSSKLSTTQAEMLLAPRPVECLYDLRNDQWEINNLSANPAYGKKLKELRLANMSNMLRLKDAGILPQAMLAQIDDGGDTIMLWRQQNLTAKHFEVADWVGRGTRYLRPQIKLLIGSKDSLLRYWAAVGLRNQTQNNPSQKTVLKLFSNEKSDMVKIELAGFLKAFYNSFVAENYLTDIILQDNNAYMVRQSLMTLINLMPLDQNNLDRIRFAKNNLVRKHKGALNYPIQAALSSLLNEPITE